MDVVSLSILYGSVFFSNAYVGSCVMIRFAVRLV